MRQPGAQPTPNVNAPPPHTSPHRHHVRIPMAVKIDKKIKGYAVVTPEDKAKEAARGASVSRAQIESQLPMADVIQMHEKIERPEVLIGSTYKIKSPLVEHAMYVTINDIVLNAGSEHEQRRPCLLYTSPSPRDS